MNTTIQKLAEVEINRATAAMKELLATAEGDQVTLAVIQYIGQNITTAINKEIVEMKGQQRVYKMVQNGKEALKQKPTPTLPDKSGTDRGMGKCKPSTGNGKVDEPPEVKP